MGRLFGTDGIRGIPGREPLVPATVRAVGRAVGAALSRARLPVNGSQPLVLLGRDTRSSGPALARELSAGLAAAGCRVLDLGVIPTPGVSYLASRTRAAGGLVVSASHNPPEFNGIKVFTADGSKLPAEGEEEVERAVARGGSPVPDGRRGRGSRPGEAAALRERYAAFLKSTFPATEDLEGLRLVVDCANGAAFRLAPALFESLGAKVRVLGGRPDGRNINRGCGATHTQALSRAVRGFRAHCGIAFDGDADRAVLCDERGRLLDGDALIGLSAMRLRRQGLLKGGVVLTVMSNFGLVRHLERRGIRVVSVPVGDRNVSDALVREDLVLGGESSGHLVFRSFAPTGDGLLTALQALAALREAGRPLSALAAGVPRVPQALLNLSVEDKPPLESLPGLQRELRRCRAELKGEGRVFLRYSGTEPLLRILVEGSGEGRVRAMAARLSRAFREGAASARLTHR